MSGPVAFREVTASRVEGSRLTAAAIAALSTIFKVGLIPQAKHDGKGVEAVAVVGSKFDGSGLENEHIEHTHVAFNAPAGRVIRVEDWVGADADVDVDVVPMLRFGGFGYTIILGDDFRKLACIWISSCG